jgi:hypothetical protein
MKLRSKSKDWLARNEDNVSQFSNISTSAQLVLKNQIKHVGPVQSSDIIS